MYRSLLAFVSTGLIVSGCNFGPKDGQVALGGCVKADTSGVCTMNMDEDGVNFAVISITDEASGSGKAGTGGRLTVTPDFLCARPGETIRLDISEALEGRKDKLRVGILPAQYRQAWLLGSNAENRREIILKVPGSSADSTDTAAADGSIPGVYKYAVVTSAGSCLDPRIHVRN